MLEGGTYLAISALWITILTALVFLALGILVGWFLWRRPCELCEEQLRRAQNRLMDVGKLERENDALKQDLDRARRETTKPKRDPKKKG